VLLRAMGDAAGHHKIPWWQRMLANLASQTGYAQLIASAEQQ